MTKKVYRVHNWNKYNKALIARGSIILWINEEVAKKWCELESPHKDRGRQKYYSDLAIQTCLNLRSLFKLPLRSVQGLVESLFILIGFKIKTPSYTQICRRQKELDLKLVHNIKGKIHVVIDGSGLKIFGEGEWKVRQHGYIKHRMWRKLHIGIDVKSQQIVMMELTDNKIGENKKFKGLLEQYEEGYSRIGADKGYDSYDCHEEVGKYDAISAINIQDAAKERKKRRDDEPPLVRDEIIRRIAEIGKEAWKEEVEYHSRSLVETGFYRYKTIFGAKMHSRKIENQKTESMICCNILNKFTSLGMPDSYVLA
jgi:Transposase DDE domain